MGLFKAIFDTVLGRSATMGQMCSPSSESSYFKSLKNIFSVKEEEDEEED